MGLGHEGQINGVKRRWLGDWTYVVVNGVVWVRQEGTGVQWDRRLRRGEHAETIARALVKERTERR